MWQEGGIDLKSDELCLIDSGINSLAALPLRPNLQTLNLHCNHIRRIEQLQNLAYLRYLDLSSNQIQRIEGLGGLVSLRVLNLSCNLIEVVEGLENLRSLVRLNLSYNQIDDLSGFKVIQGQQYKLSQVELHGNRVHSLEEVTECMSGCLNLRHLALVQGGANNPVCQQSGYRRTVFASLPQLEVLDGSDRRGQPVVADDILADIPGLEEYMEFLLSNGSSDLNPIALATPRIDTALEQFRHRGATSPEISTITSQSEGEAISHQYHKQQQQQQQRSRQQYSSADTTSSPKSQDKSGLESSEDYGGRLEKLEQQLAQLLHKPKGSSTTGSRGGSTRSTPTKKASAHSRVTKHMAKRDIDQTDESDESSPMPSGRRGWAVAGSAQTRPTRAAQTSRRAAGSGTHRQNINTSTTSGTEDDAFGARGGATQKTGSGGASVARKLKNTARLASSGAREATAVARDAEMRDDVQTTYLQLMNELESERERRWKAEQATKKLVEHIKQLQSKAKEEEGLQDVALQATSRLKDALSNEREAKTRLLAGLEVTKEEAADLKDQLQTYQQAEAENRKAMQTLEQTLTSKDREYLQQQAHQAHRLQESQLKAAATTREAELLRSQVKTLKGQLHQLQELLAAREQEHRKELNSRYSLGSQELKDMVDKEASRVKTEYTQELGRQQQTIEKLTKQYGELEDEFRLALQIESSRFKELQSAFERASKENAENKQALLAAQRKDESTSSMITELTSLVKEQKGRISELSKSKQEQTYDLKERVQTLEAHLEEARRRMVQLELLKQEKVKLQSQLQAQESVIEGLKSERKLWGEELAQQGASLAQDRGRMEAKIETQSAEVVSLKKQLEREADAVRIKTKMIEDQTETIRKLKEGVVERDEQVKTAREDVLRIQRDLEEQLSAETALNQDLQEKLDRALQRKDELKDQMLEMKEQIEDSKKAHGVLNNKWKEKSTLIGQLEKQVRQMKESWEAKEEKLTEERDRAMEAASTAVERLRNVDDAFRKQLDSKEHSHQVALRALAEEKQVEIDLANKRVIEVEDEMRCLLRETEASKRSAEEKMKKLTSVFAELQKGM